MLPRNSRAIESKNVEIRSVRHPTLCVLHVSSACGCLHRNLAEKKCAHELRQPRVRALHLGTRLRKPDDIRDNLICWTLNPRAGRSPASGGRAVQVRSRRRSGFTDRRKIPDVEAARPMIRPRGICVMPPFPARSLPSPPIQAAYPDAPWCGRGPSCPAQSQRCFPAGGLPPTKRSR